MLSNRGSEQLETGAKLFSDLYAPKKHWSKISGERSDETYKRQAMKHSLRQMIWSDMSKSGVAVLWNLPPDLKSEIVKSNIAVIQYSST